MSLLSLQNVHFSAGAEDILRGIGGEINAGDRIGLVGRNGAGKTTLLHILTGELQPTAGARHLARGTTMALVEQVQPAESNRNSVYVEALDAVADLVRLEEALERAGDELSAGTPGASEEYARLHDEFEAKDGYSYRTRVSQVLTGLGFLERDWSEPVLQLSGGQRTRLALARALLARPDLLLLDEPTNHIDLEAMSWLDSFLARWPGSLVVTSHDRYFLDRVANRVWLLEQGTVRTYRGNYAAFEEQRRLELDLLRRQAEAQAETIAREEAFIRRYRAGQRAREAKGRQKRLDRLERIEAPRDLRAASFNLRAARSGDIVLVTDELGAGYDGNQLVRIGSLEVERGDRIAVIGPNGAGKTTLLRTLAGELQPVSGRQRLGANVSVGHYWQEAENLDPGRTVLEEIRRGRFLEPQQARGVLGRFLFSGTDVDKPVSALSGGERSRLALAKLVIEDANLLLLDEPTNHLDIPSREALEQALDTYTGSFILVSHDRQLIAGVANRIWSIEDGKLVDFDGGYEDFIDRSGPPPALVTAAVKPRVQAPQKPSPKTEAMISALEATIGERERELAGLGDAINQASKAGDMQALAQLGSRFTALEEEIALLLDEWSAYHA